MPSWKKDLLYAGLDREEFLSLLPGARRENSKNLKAFSLIMAGMFFVLFLMRIPSQDLLSVNAPVYLGASLACFAIYFCVIRLLPAHPEATLPLVHLFVTLLYIFSFILLFLHRDLPSVTAIVVLLVAPFLFTARPLTTVCLSVAAMIVFCLLCLWQKSPELASLDIWNALTFGFLAVIASVFRMKGKFRFLLQAKKIKYLSETDLLTGAKNRNCYESNMNIYQEKCEKNVGCLFADVNGLHDLNNREGHKAGDVMLQTAAETIIARFGPEDTYRVGGDEFVAFRMDTDLETLEREAKQIAESLSAVGYHTSVGAACGEKAELDMLQLVQDAEKDMYTQKQVYYQQVGHDRRRR